MVSGMAVKRPSPIAWSADAILWPKPHGAIAVNPWPLKLGKDVLSVNQQFAERIRNAMVPCRPLIPTRPFADDHYAEASYALSRCHRDFSRSGWPFRSLREWRARLWLFIAYGSNRA